MPQVITLVTGNPGKLAEWQRLFPAEFRLEAVDVDLDEIQSLDLEVIAVDKAKRAYEKIGTPVLVEDVAVGLDKMKGMPGPFIKYFEVAMGRDALHQLAGAENEPGIATCTIAYFDGKTALTASGAVRGAIVSPRGEFGFGFDRCFVPVGQSKTFGEMAPDEKDAISHRALAVKELVAKLRHELSN